MHIRALDCNAGLWRARALDTGNDFASGGLEACEIAQGSGALPLGAIYGRVRLFQESAMSAVDYADTVKNTHTQLKTNALNFWEVTAQSIALISPSMTAALIIPLMFGTAG